MKRDPAIVNGVVVQDGRVLIARRSLAKKVAPGKYHLPGGHVEPGETAESAVLREFLEEFGMRVRPTGVSYDFSYSDGNERVNGVCFVLSWDTDAESIQMDLSENDELAWIGAEEIGAYFDPSDHNFMLLSRYFGSVHNL